MTDDLITDHPYQGELRAGASCQYEYPGKITGIKSVHGGFDNYEMDPGEICARQAMEHANPGNTLERHLLKTKPHDFAPSETDPTLCAFSIGGPKSTEPYEQVCGYPERLHHWADQDRQAAAKKAMGLLVRVADVAQYERPPMPDAARLGPVVTLIDAPVDPLGTLAVIGGIYTGHVYRSKSEVDDEARRQMLIDMQQTVLNGPLESIQFTFLVEGVSRSITHQFVRNRFAFFAQESLRFAVAEDWAQEVPLPPSAAQDPEGVLASVFRKAMNQSEDNYNALIGAGMPAEEARDVLAHGITTRLHWVVSLRTLLAEAGKRTCTQAQFPWRQVFSGVAKAFRERTMYAPGGGTYIRPRAVGGNGPAFDGWQYEAFADLIRPVCYQQGKCGFMAKFDRGCTIRARVDAFERAGVPSTEWHKDAGVRSATYLEPIDPAEWAADPAAARVREGHPGWDCAPECTNPEHEGNTQEPCDTCSGAGCAECR